MNNKDFCSQSYSNEIKEKREEQSRARVELDVAISVGFRKNPTDNGQWTMNQLVHTLIFT
jgi:hypothetical protein